MKVHIFDLLVTIASALDLVEDSMYTHHHKVAYISYRIGEQMGIGHDRLKSLVFAALIHDVGVITKREKESLIDFNVSDTESHSVRGYNFLKGNSTFAYIAEIIRDHHRYYNRKQNILLESSILHLADRVEVLTDTERDIFGQVSEINAKIEKRKGTMFAPLAVDAFKAVAKDMNFWQILKSPNIFEWFSRRLKDESGYLSDEQLTEISSSLARVIDFRSPFTFAHSTNVALIAEIIGDKLFGDKEMKQKLKIAGYLHDIGKLVVPEETIDKGRPLTGAEGCLVQTHPFYTNILLKQMGDLEDITEMAAYHHERLNGSGYPYHIENERLELKHQVIGISDILAALNEDRAYRLKKNRNYILSSLENCNDSKLFSEELLSVTGKLVDEIIERTSENSVKMLNEYVKWNNVQESK